MKRTLGLPGVFCISAGAMISSGLFVLPGLAYAGSGPAVFVSYFIAGLTALTTVLSLSELVTAMPMAGGDYFYVSRSFGRLFGTVSGLLSWLALSLKSAFAVIGIAELAYLVFGIDLTVSAVVLAVLFTLINLFGVQEAVRFQIALVLALLAILLVFAATGTGSIVPSRYIPFLPMGWNSMFSTAGFVFVSFGGVLTTASIAGEIKNPSRTIPAGLIGSTVIVMLLYSLVTFTVVGIVPPAELAESLAPIALAGSRSGGPVLYFAITAASLLAFITTANGGILTASRYPVALSSDRMLPSFFSNGSKKKNTPYVSIISTGILITSAVFVNLGLLIKAASTVILLSNIFAHLSVIIMRESNISNYRPTYRAPLYPWLQIAGIIVFVLLIIDMGIQPILISLAFVSAGIILYFVRRRKTDAGSPALVHMLERITNKQLASSGLKRELRSIVEDRDGIVKDDFDETVERSAYFEINARTDVSGLLPSLAREIHTSLLPDMDSEEIERLLKTREAESSTALNHFVAIPHIIIEGSGVFELMLVKAGEGVFFNSMHPSLRAVFVLIGSKDMRNLHLRSLAAIAQLCQQPGFEREWMSAKGHAEIKDLLMLSSRQRFSGESGSPSAG